MTQQEIRELLTPFQPLTIVLDNGDQFPIAHPDQILTSPTTAMVMHEGHLVKFAISKIAKLDMDVTAPGEGASANRDAS